MRQAPTNRASRRYFCQTGHFTWTHRLMGVSASAYWWLTAARSRSLVGLELGGDDGDVVPLALVDSSERSKPRLALPLSVMATVIAEILQGDLTKGNPPNGLTTR